MAGAHAASTATTLQADQAMNVSNDIIVQLLSHTSSDPSRPSCRKFMETHGHTRIDGLELDLANFVSNADTLTLEGVPFMEPCHGCTMRILATAKDIVEQQAARLKGWGMPSTLTRTPHINMRLIEN